MTKVAKETIMSAAEMVKQKLIDGECMAKASNTSRPKLFLLFIGEDRSSMAAPKEHSFEANWYFFYESINQPPKMKPANKKHFFAHFQATLCLRFVSSFRANAKSRENKN